MRKLLTLLLALLGTFQAGACAALDTRAVPVDLSERITVGETYQGIRLLGTLRLPDAPVNGLRPHGLSGLAWDEDAGLLYAVSDRGNLFHLRPSFTGDRLTGAEFVAAYPLRDAAGRPLRSSFADAEGLAIINGANRVRNDSELLISFEVQVRAARYRPDGTWLRNEPLPAVLRKVARYVNGNQSLEAITWHPQWGMLLGAERPLRDEPGDAVPLVAADGRQWRYPLYPAPQSSLVAMEALPDGSLLTLERAFVSLTRPLIISLRRTRLATTSALLRVADVAVFDTSQGWLLDNFEGLTRQRDRRFFMISDDNDNLLQNTLLVYFELLPTPGEPPW